MPHTVTVKGQVLVPKHIREQTGIGPGSRIEWEIDAQGRAVMVKLAGPGGRERAQQTLAAIDQAAGSLADIDAYPELSTDSFMGTLREPLEPFEIEAARTGQPIKP
jgi:AbrB family looped-hinge helix DNA binding protein